MALIKGTDTDQLSQDVIVLDLGDLRREGEKLSQLAKEKAKRIISEAREDAVHLADGAEKDGYASGYEKGCAEGREVGREEGHAQALRDAAEQLSQLQKAWARALMTWEQEREKMFTDARQMILQTALVMAKKIVLRVPKVDENAVVDQVTRALEYVGRPSNVTITINPDDREIINQALPGLIEINHQLKNATLIDDSLMQRGGCVITYGKGRIDATLEGQLDRLVHSIIPDGLVTDTPSPAPNTNSDSDAVSDTNTHQMPSEGENRL